MSDDELRKELASQGITATPDMMALARELEPIVDRVIAQLEAKAEDLSVRSRTPWFVAGLVSSMVSAIAIRDENVRRFNRMYTQYMEEEAQRRKDAAR